MTLRQLIDVLNALPDSALGWDVKSYAQGEYFPLTICLLCPPDARDDSKGEVLLIERFAPPVSYVPFRIRIEPGEYLDSEPPPA